MKHLLPTVVSDPAFYSLIAMAAVFGGIARAPFTSIVFLFELSHNPNALLPLVVCVMISDGFVRLCSRDSIMTVKLVKRGLIVLQDYSVPVLMRARIDQVMRRQFRMFNADDELRHVLEKFVPDDEVLFPVVDASGGLIGIVEPHDLLRTEPPDHHYKMRELARRDFVLAFPGESVDQVHRDMMLRNTENVVVVDSNGTPRKPLGTARANDILQLRRWLMEEETRESKEKLRSTVIKEG
jgi:CBS domain-containing protein